MDQVDAGQPDEADGVNERPAPSDEDGAAEGVVLEPEAAPVGGKPVEDAEEVMLAFDVLVCGRWGGGVGRKARL